MSFFRVADRPVPRQPCWLAGPAGDETMHICHRGAAYITRMHQTRSTAKRDVHRLGGAVSSLNRVAQIPGLHRWVGVGKGGYLSG